MEDWEVPLIKYRCNDCLSPIDPDESDEYTCFIYDDGLCTFKCNKCEPLSMSLFDEYD